MNIQLFKKTSTYIDKEKVERKSVQFYLQCGDTLIPIEVTYFKDKTTGKDAQYGGRREVLKAFASEFPKREKTQEKTKTDEPVDEKNDNDDLSY